MRLPKFVFCGDFLRCNAWGTSTQNSNIRWLHYLTGPLLKALGHEQQICLADESGIDSSNLALEFYRCAGMLPGPDAWARIFDSSCSPRQLALLAEQFADSIAVSFELPDILIKAFAELEVPFIDFTIHPVRFMHDLIFVLRTNIPELMKIAPKWATPDAGIELEANMVRATYIKKPPLPLPCAELALIACQVDHDRSLIRNGRFVDYTMFIPELAAICAKYDTVLVKRHPCQPNSGMADYLFRTFPNTMPAPDDFYACLCDPRLREVISITSSASIEAGWLGKTGTHLGTYRLAISACECSPDTGLQTGAVFMNAKFWQDVLQALELPCKEWDLPPVPINLRKSLNNYWGAVELYR